MTSCTARCAPPTSRCTRHPGTRMKRSATKTSAQMFCSHSRPAAAHSVSPQKSTAQSSWHPLYYRVPQTMSSPVYHLPWHSAPALTLAPGCAQFHPSSHWSWDRSTWVGQVLPSTTSTAESMYSYRDHNPHQLFSILHATPSMISHSTLSTLPTNTSYTPISSPTIAVYLRPSWYSCGRDTTTHSPEPPSSDSAPSHCTSARPTSSKLSPPLASQPPLTSLTDLHCR